MRYDWEGMSLWFEPAESASDQTIPAGAEATITVAVAPADASNRVEVRYRVNGGPSAILAADPVRHVRDSQYFRVRLPTTAFRPGDIVEYTALCRCAGRQVPSPEEAEHFALSLRVVDDGATVTPNRNGQHGPSHAETRNIASLGLPEIVRMGAPASVAPQDPTFAPMSMTALPAAMFVVRGQVSANGSPVGGIRIRAFDKDLRRERPLGETTTNGDGRYEIRYNTEHCPEVNGRHVNLLVRAFNLSGVELGASGITFNAPATATIDLAITRTDDVQRSEYERLLSVLTPFLGDVALANLIGDDVAFLTQATPIDRQSLELLRQSAQLSLKTGVPAEAFFGLARTGFSLDLDALVAFQAESLRHAIEMAVDKAIIPKTLRQQSATLIRRLKRYNHVPHQAEGQLLNQQSGLPLAGFTVQVFDLNGDGDSQALGSVRTNGKGMFTFSYSAPPTKLANGMTLEFLCKVSDAKGQPLAEHKVQIEPGQTGVAELRISMPASEVPPSPTISDLASMLNLSIPRELLSHLSKRNIITLADIRNAGGLARLGELPLPPGHPAVEVLDAHADLSRLSPDVRVNASLIAKGYTSVAAIADAPRSTFLEATHETLGDFKAARMHVVARAQTAFLDNVLIGTAAAQKTVAGLDAASGLPLLDQQCTCEDCESAISPAFYLADLLKYATDHIQRDGQQVSLQFLADTFHQPFDALQVSCKAVDQLVRSARICAEVLRASLGPRPLTDPQKESALQKVELDYLTSAYTQLLHQIGTSYDEIRLTRSDTAENRKALAQRLGIELTSPRPAAGDELDRLFLAFPDVVGSSATLVQLSNLERQIEQLFGLVDSQKDPLSDGAKFGDDPANPSIVRWNLQGVEWGRNTDQDGNIYVTESLGAFFSISLYKDPQRSERVAFGERPTTFGPVTLLPQDSSNLSGGFNIASFETLSNILVLSVIPSFLSWRLKHLRTIWAQEDYPADAYASGSLPLIDPDLIGPDDFRSPVPKASAAAPNTTAFDLWLTRRGAIDTILNTLQRDRETNTDGMAFILKKVFGDPLPNFDSLLQELTQGDKNTVRAATDAILNLNLSVNSFTRLMEIRSKDAQSRGGPGEPVNPDEWGEVYAILAQVQKIRLFSAWRAEEVQLNIILGMRDFWVSLREPGEGAWPPAQLVSAQTPATPLIDPDLQTLKDLPEPVAGSPGITLWTDRSAQLRTTNATLASTRQSSGFEAMLKFALGDPLPHDLDQLRKDLASSNQAVVIASQNAITNDLHLTLDGFAQMMTIRDKDAQNDPGKKPTDAEYAVIEALLTRAWKIRVAHPQWISDETSMFTAEGQTAGGPFIAYWRLRKAALPRWRASVEARQAWQQALQSRSAQPIIDPDIVDEYDFRDLVPDPKAAYGIRQTRWSEISDRISAIITTPAQTKEGLDKLFQNLDYIGLKTDDLSALDRDRSMGNSIQSRLDQLGLSNAAFDTLLRVSKLILNGQPVLPSEWMDVASILVQTFKKKRLADWRLEEQSAAILLSSDFFQARPSSTDPLSPAPAPVLPGWRATIADRRDWQDTLQSRIDEQKSTIDGMRQAVSATEAANLQILRDGLVMAAAAAGGSDLDRAADWVTKRFLIDAKVDASQTTTRVEQAIETLQSLLLALSSASFNPSGFEMAGGIAAVKGPDTIDIFGRGADNALWRMSGDGDNSWSDWESLGSVFSFDPAVCSSSPGRLDVFALRPDSAAPLRTDPHVWQRTFQNSVWSDWQPVGAAAGNNLGTVAAASWGPDTIDVFVSEVQTDGGSFIQHAHFENDAWSAWEIVPGSNQKHAPAVASRGFQRLDLFATGINDGAVWRLEYDNGWKSWELLGGVASSTPSACATSPTQLSVFVRGTDMALYQDTFVEGSGWSGWASLGGVLSSGPSAVALSPARMDVFVRGGEAQLWHRRSLNGIWGDWAPIILVPVLTLQAASFSEDWKWVGSYAKWRAAMLVFLYPENLLRPTLRPTEQQTPGFQKLIDDLSTGGSITPEAALQVSKEYETYFNDVCNLVVQATCHAQPIIDLVTEDKFFMFARRDYGNLTFDIPTERIYWSAYDLNSANPGFAQTFWTKVNLSGTNQKADPAAKSNPPEILKSVVKLIGAVPTDSQHIFLVVQTLEGSAQKLAVLRFDIETEEWNVVTQNLPIPGGASSFQAEIFQDSGLPPPGGNQVVLGTGRLIGIGIKLPDKSSYFGYLSSDGTAWAAGYPILINVGSIATHSLALARRGNFADAMWLETYSDNTSNLNSGWHAYVTDPSVPNFASVGFAITAAFHGMAWLPFQSDMTIYNDGSGLAFFIFSDWPAPAVLSPYFPTRDQEIRNGVQQIDAIVPSMGRLNQGGPSNFVYKHRPSGAFRRCTFKWADDTVTLDIDVPVAPTVQQPLDIPGNLPAGALQERRREIEQTFLNNYDLPASLRAYLEEAYYFVPILLALQLQRSGEYEAALGWFRTVYDYTAPNGDERKIYYGLKAEESIQEIYKRPDNWLSNPLNPHAIAGIRGNTYTRYTLLCIVKCQLDYADAEFSQDTGESVVRARNLYQTALDLLDTDVLKQRSGDCAILSGALNGNTGAGISSGALLARLKTRLANISERDRLRDTVVRIQGVLRDGGSPDHRFIQADQLAAQAEAESAPSTMGEVLSESRDLREQLYLSVAGKPGVDAAMQSVGEAARADFTMAMTIVTNLTAEQLDSEPALAPWLRVTSRSDVNANDGTGTANLTALQTYQRFQIGFVPSAAALWGCIPPNPTPASLRQHAEVNLRKLRSGRNIAGMIRDLDPYAAPTNTATALPTIGAGGQLNLPGTVSIQPTLYRYTVIIERAKQLTQTAIQMEAAMLAALEKADDKAYGLLKARQDLNLSQANTALQNLKVTEANARVDLAKSQRSRVDDQIKYYNDLLTDTASNAYQYEQQALKLLSQAADAQDLASNLGVAAAAAYGVSAIPGAASGAMSGVALGAEVGAVAGPAGALAGMLIGGALGAIIGGSSGFAAGLGALASSASSSAARDSTNATIMSTQAAYERRRDEWQFQLTLANDDAAIGKNQVDIANDDVDIAKQEKTMADLQHTNAVDVVEFLTNEFTNAELFYWVSGILEGVYTYFLRQASAMARLAENQVAFERQQAATGFIQGDYWAPSADIQSTVSSAGPDRKGLTGAERLLEDITQLDQFAFLTDTRKLQLVKTLSLGRLAPAEFQRFRETGLMTFNTPMELFDRDFPGHYLRLISRIRTTVIALIPPNQGIAATLSSSGLSRVVIGGDVFQTIPIRRQPESVAVSSPMGATGVSELTPQSNLMLLPFENTGVDTTWEFRMEKASNLFDYSTIADVLVTIEYTALSSLDYRQQVIQSLSPTISADRPYSFRNQFSDQWYDLHNPAQSPTPMTVRFKTFPEDFPPNIEDVRIQQVVLYFSRAVGPTFEVPVMSLRFTALGDTGAVGGGSTSIDGVISTRRGNAGSWTAMIGKTPFGDWELALPDGEETRGHFVNDEIQDILFVITYSGKTPEWNR